LSQVAALLCLAGVGLLAACSDNGAGSLTGVDETGGSAALDASTASPSLDAVSSDGFTAARLETNLRPAGAPNSHGQLSLRNGGQFRTEITIADADFGAMGITPANGFNDEVVRLVVTRAGTQVFSTRVPFADRNPASVDFKKTFGASLQAGDVAKAIVNGHLALRGTLRDN
jgi:hypothetical protein